MSTSQNGWSGIESGSDERLVRIPKIIGRVRGGDVAVILADLVDQFDAHVEDVDLGADDWGHAYRDVREGASLSNHASGTAIDLNATRHPLGKVGTFTPTQVAALRKILARYGGVVRWGGDYSGRKDEMHFEIVGNAAQVAAVADRLRSTGGGAVVAPTPAPVPVPDVQEDDMTPEQDARLKAVESKLAQLGATQEIVFFESAGTVYEASLLSGTYRALSSKATLTDRKAVLGAAGIPFRNWTDSVGNREVANPAAFGIRVG